MEVTKLPLSCRHGYYPQVLADQESEELFQWLCTNCDITNRIVVMEDGSEVEMETGAFLFADEELTSFEKLPKVWGERMAWPPLLQALKEKVEKIVGHEFQVCRLIYYQDGTSGMGFHHDPPAYGDTSQIASVSLGAEREFLLRGIKDPKEQHSLILKQGSLFFMGEGFQEQYEHAIPEDPSCQEPRINLTFRRYGWD